MVHSNAADGFGRSVGSVGCFKAAATSFRPQSLVLPSRASNAFQWAMTTIQTSDKSESLTMDTSLGVSNASATLPPGNTGAIAVATETSTATQIATEVTPEDQEKQNESETVVEYRTYPMRWFAICVLSTLGTAQTLGWNTFSPVAQTAALYYEVPVSAINWVSRRGVNGAVSGDPSRLRLELAYACSLVPTAGLPAVTRTTRANDLPSQTIHFTSILRFSLPAFPL